MGYLHIDNLYKDTTILMFRECYALEKVHGSSAHISWRDNQLTYAAGGESHERFVQCLPMPVVLAEAFMRAGHPELTVYGEVYGGKCQGMRETYGVDLKFIAFDVRVGDAWLDVPDMVSVVERLGLEVVPWQRMTTDVAALDAHRDEPSIVAKRRLGPDVVKTKEGVVLRPLIELTRKNGARIIAKHKGAAFAERQTPPPVVDAARLEVLRGADAIATEWVTAMRLQHVLQKFPADVSMHDTRRVIDAMVEDVTREARGEIELTRDAVVAIGKQAAKLFKAHVMRVPTL